MDDTERKLLKTILDEFPCKHEERVSIEMRLEIDRLATAIESLIERLDRMDCLSGEKR